MSIYLEVSIGNSLFLDLITFSSLIVSREEDETVYMNTRRTYEEPFFVENRTWIFITSSLASW